MKFLESAFYDKKEWWRYVVMIFVVFLVAQAMGSIPLLVVIFIKSGYQFPLNSGNNLLDFDQYGISRNIGLILILIPFILNFFLFKWVFKLLHIRKFSQVYNGRNFLRWKRFLIGFLVWVIIMSAHLIIGLIFNGDLFILQLNWEKWMFLIAISLLLIPIQTTIEELIFRGYMAQGIGLMTRNRMMAILIPSVVFGLLHAGNPEIMEYGFWKTIPSYIIIGLAMGFISIMDDGIELAVGMHAANNIFLSIFITTEHSVFQTDALFLLTEIDIDGQTLTSIFDSIVAIVVLWMIYRWDWKILWKKINPQDSKEDSIDPPFIV